jgi:hypothetical protein
METTTKSGFTVIQMVEIPENNLSKRILKELSGRENFIDADTDLGEQIFAGTVFEDIACEQAEMPLNSPLRLSDEDLKRIDELAEELGEFELIRINKI